MAAPHAGRIATRRFVIDQNHEINVTPFIDVMLVLLIVFIIAAPLATTAIKVDIAAGRGGAARIPVNVMLDDRGGIQIQSASGATPTSLERLASDLAKAGAPDPAHGWVIVSGAPHTRYGAFMAVMDRLHGEGFANVTLAANPA